MREGDEGKGGNEGGGMALIILKLVLMTRSLSARLCGLLFERLGLRKHADLDQHA